jgi:hypothetical protein
MQITMPWLQPEDLPAATRLEIAIAPRGRFPESMAQ